LDSRPEGKDSGLICLPPLPTRTRTICIWTPICFFGLHRRFSINRSNGEGLNRHRDRKIFTIRNLAGYCRVHDICCNLLRSGYNCPDRWRSPLAQNLAPSRDTPRGNCRFWRR
jgi:hypothetical protein